MGLLNALDLDAKIEKSDYQAEMEKLEIKMGQLQRKAWNAMCPLRLCLRAGGLRARGG